MIYDTLKQFVDILPGFALALLVFLTQNLINRAYQRREYMLRLNNSLFSTLKDLNAIKGSFAQFEQHINKIKQTKKVYPVGFPNYQIDNISKDIPFCLEGGGEENL